ncbi:4-alpha-glucanotransferase [uncultured Bacteroides sp.]|uniref:4-alpha-glucanotransferase n=1 Tax=uncultured Bacteroides sp. TaxID=162156 RepID=UPI002AAB10C0|nr:4-alpha-glucanotransferase [uncultured Bacteroides sp.]
MIVSFHIEYRTNWGEDVRILGSDPKLGMNDPHKAIILQTKDGTHWKTEIEIQSLRKKKIEYSYFIYKDNKIIRKEWNGLKHSLILSSNITERKYRIYDNWKNSPTDQYFYSSAFTQSLLSHPKQSVKTQNLKKSLIIKAYSPCISSDYCLGISGNQEILGNWNADNAWIMSDTNFPEWIAELDATKISYPLEYKFILYNKKKKKTEIWENNPNRYLADPQINTNETCVIADRFVYFDRAAWKGAGVAIPIFSLKSENSFGVGDFGDLKLMIDWAVQTGQKVVQILPVNDTTMTHTWADSYPYNSISIYAFHPMYTDLKQLGTLHDPKKQEYFLKKQKKLNSLLSLDYEAVNQTKWEYLQLIFEQEGEKVLSSKEFHNFYKSNKEWLQPYAVFSYLRDIYHTANFRQWPQHGTFQKKEIEKLCHPDSPAYPDISIYFYVQFNLHLQLLKASLYAREKGVVLKGDIPIGISRNSVEAWTEPYYFNLDGQAGAPPDDFSINGQNWGFPTYNWEVMEQDGYQWWMKRFQKMSEYFDAYRIDHILGFFRIWEIPMHAVHGLLGQFSPSLPMSKEEIESYGLTFNSHKFLEPYIHEYFLPQIFGTHTEYVKKNFIESTNTWEIYQMRPEFNTQRKVEAYFADKTDPDSLAIRDGLYTLISDVLFVPDHKNPNQYHPRIGVQHDFIYRALSDWEKEAFNRLYDHYFYHRHNEFWREQAMKKLPQLTQSTQMLVCGEDLGMIPDCVAWVMNDLKILSLEIQRMPKNPREEFGQLQNYPYQSVCTISTHDMSTLRGWWEEDYQQTQRYFNHILGHYGNVPSTATPELCEEVVRNHLYSNSILCILALQDWLSIDKEWWRSNIKEERINIPSNPKHYWRYRTHFTLEKLLQANRLNTKIKDLIEKTERSGK